MNIDAEEEETEMVCVCVERGHEVGCVEEEYADDDGVDPTESRKYISSDDQTDFSF